MITMWDVYWITRLDYIIESSMFMFILSLVLLAAVVIARVIAQSNQTDWGTFREWREPYRKNFTKYLSLALVPFLLFLTVLTFIPNTQNACAIYLIPKIVNNEQVQKIPNNFAKLLNTKMEEWINESIMDKKQGDK